EILNFLSETSIDPDEINPYLVDKNSGEIREKKKLSQILLRPGISLNQIAEVIPSVFNFIKVYPKDSVEEAEIQLKYDIYIKKEEEMFEKMSSLEGQMIPEHFNYEKITSLSNEARQKFLKIRPQTLGQASRISGVNPTDVQILMVYMGR
ncbi:MAG: tRNA uridine-5-carboxymethylaminomethyl(34) synthesis enzyme MnmG, partial [Ginsengibacter sp.]